MKVYYHVGNSAKSDAVIHNILIAILNKQMDLGKAGLSTLQLFWDIWIVKDMHLHLKHANIRDILHANPVENHTLWDWIF